MKNLIGTFLLAIALLALSCHTACAQRVVVKVRPPAKKVVVVKPAAPSANYVWVSGNWKWNPRTNSHVWVDGRWMKAISGKRYVPGHWAKTRGGYHYVQGHWIRA